MKKDLYLASRRNFLMSGIGAVLIAPKLRADDDKVKNCPITEDNIEGPFWLSDAPFRAKLRDDGQAGEVLIVSGKVEGFPGCIALKDAVIDVWQANHSGHYDNEDSSHELAPKDFKLRGRMKASEQGAYEFETVIPGAYKISPKQFRPAHIHFKVSCPGYTPLTTQLYFKGDPYLEQDPWAKKSLIKELQKQENKEELKKRNLTQPFKTCTFDVVLKKLSKSSYGGD